MSLPPRPDSDQPPIVRQLVLAGTDALTRIPPTECVVVITPRAIVADQPTPLRVARLQGIEDWEDREATYQPWPGYVFAMIGRQVPAPHSGAAGWPYWPCYLPDGSLFVLQAWYLAAATVDGVFSAEISWTPEHGAQKAIREVAPIWHTPDWPRADLPKAGEAMALLHTLQRTPARANGRQEDTGDFRIGQDARFLAYVRPSIEELVTHGQRVNDTTVADNLGRDRKTIAKYRKLFHVNWTQLEDEVRREIGA